MEPSLEQLAIVPEPVSTPTSPESVTSHGPMDSKRHQELATLFKKVNIDIVYVTAFLSRKTFSKYASVSAWET